jgi:hypothetical protein
MGKTLFIHIGAHKTGSTAIQNFLSINRNILKECGTLYPGKAQNHYPISEELRTHKKPYLDRTTWTYKIFKEIVDKIEHYHNFVISSEGFYEDIKKVVPALFETIQYFNLPLNIKIIFFCRRQDSWLESAYQQTVKEFKERNTLQFNQYIKLKPLLEYIDYYKALDLYGQFFGRENLIIFPYESRNICPEIFNIFCGILNILDITNFKKPKNSASNIGLEAESVEFLRWLNLLEINDDLFLKIKYILTLREKKKVGNYNFLSQNTAIELLHYFEESNRKIANEFLNIKNERLFNIEIENNKGKSIDQENPENNDFSNLIQFIDSKNHEAILRIFFHLTLFYSPDYPLFKIKKQLINLLLEKIPFYQLNRIQSFTQFQVPNNSILIEQFEKSNFLIKINSENFFLETNNYSKDILDNIVVQSGNINLISSGIDPYFNLMKIPGDFYHVITIKIIIEVPEDTTFMIYYQTKTNPQFTESKSLRGKVFKGENWVYIMIVNEDFNGHLRLDPGTAKGFYSISEIEVRSNIRNYDELIYENRWLKNKIENIELKNAPSIKN